MNEGAERKRRNAPQEYARYTKETNHKIKFISLPQETYKEGEAHVIIPEHALPCENQQKSEQVKTCLRIC